MRISDNRSRWSIVPGNNKPPAEWLLYMLRQCSGLSLFYWLTLGRRDVIQQHGKYCSSKVKEGRRKLPALFYLDNSATSALPCTVHHTDVMLLVSSCNPGSFIRPSANVHPSPPRAVQSDAIALRPSTVLEGCRKGFSPESC